MKRTMAATIGQPDPTFTIGDERLSTSDVGDAVHWVNVYTELLNGVRGIGVSDDSAKDRWIRMLTSRLDLWKARLAEIRRP